jgi:hypothetical protein
LVQLLVPENRISLEENQLLVLITADTATKEVKHSEWQIGLE